MARFVKGLLSFVCVYSFEVVKKYIKNGNIKTRLNNLLAQP
jgi:hypothetical protein